MNATITLPAPSSSRCPLASGGRDVRGPAVSSAVRSAADLQLVALRPSPCRIPVIEFLRTASFRPSRARRDQRGLSRRWKVTMRPFLAILMTLLSVEVHAQSNLDPTRMTCAETKATIRRLGAAVLRWNAPGTGVPRYDRYVRNASYCSLSQTMMAAFVPTRDRKSCGLNKCGPKSDD